MDISSVFFFVKLSLASKNEIILQVSFPFSYVALISTVVVPALKWQKNMLSKIYKTES